MLGHAGVRLLVDRVASSKAPVGRTGFAALRAAPADILSGVAALGALSLKVLALIRVS